MPHIKSAHAYNMCARGFAALTAKPAPHTSCCGAATALPEGGAAGIGTLNALNDALPVAGREPAPDAPSGHLFRVVRSRETQESPMPKFKLEYIWLDGYTPVPSLRG